MANVISRILSRLAPILTFSAGLRGAAVSHAEARLALAGAEPSPRPPVGSEGPCCPLCSYHGLQKLNTGDVRCGRCGEQFPGNDIRAATAGQSAVQVARVGFRDLDRPLYARDVRRRFR
jgi:hypothetical protein